MHTLISPILFRAIRSSNYLSLLKNRYFSYSEVFVQSLLGTWNEISNLNPEIQTLNRKQKRKRIKHFNWKNILNSLMDNSDIETLQKRNIRTLDAHESPIKTRKLVEVVQPKFLNEEKLGKPLLSSNSIKKIQLGDYSCLLKEILKQIELLNSTDFKISVNSSTFYESHFMEYVEKQLRNHEKTIQEEGIDIKSKVSNFEESNEDFNRIEKKPYEWIIGDSLEDMILDEHKPKKWNTIPSLLRKGHPFSKSLLDLEDTVELRSVPFYIKTPIVKNRKLYNIYTPFSGKLISRENFNQFRKDWFILYWKRLWSAIYITPRGKKIVPYSIRRCYFNPLYSTIPQKQIFYYEAKKLSSVVKKQWKLSCHPYEKVIEFLQADIKYNEKEKKAKRKNWIYPYRQIIFDTKKYNRYHMSIKMAQDLHRKTLILRSDLGRPYPEPIFYKKRKRFKKFISPSIGKEGNYKETIMSNKETPLISERYKDYIEKSDFKALEEDLIVKSDMYDD